MKILHVISGGETGGSKNHVLSLFEGNTTNEMMLLVFQKGKLYDEAKAKGINVQLMDQKNRYDVFLLKKLRAFILAHKIQIIHSHGARANLFVRLILNRISAKWVVTVHSDPDLDFMHNRKMSRVFSALNKWALPKTDRIFAVSDRFKTMLKNYGIPDKKIVPIYNGISFDQGKITARRDKFSLHEDDFAAAIVARLHPVKGHSTLFKAIAKVKEEFDITVLIVGEGDMKNNLIAEADKLNISNNVRFLGYRTDIDEILSIADVSLLTSQSESFPLVLLESAREETSIITTDVGGVRDLIPDPSYGWVVPIGDPDALAKAITEAYMMKQTGELQQKGTKLRKFAENKFSVQQLQKSIEDEYSKLVKE